MAKILIIDDDAQMRRMIVHILQDAAHEVIEAKDGREGMRLFRAHQPALVITDLLMPGQEGIETIRELRHDAPGLPILAISGGGQFPRVAVLDVATKLGATAALAKPFRGTALIDAVGKLLSA